MTAKDSEEDKKKREVTGSWKRDEIYREGVRKREMWVEDEKEIEGGNGGVKRRAFMHDWCLR